MTVETTRQPFAWKRVGGTSSSTRPRWRSSRCGRPSASLRLGRLTVDELAAVVRRVHNLGQPAQMSFDDEREGAV
jgi:hypothetical protein